MIYVTRQLLVGNVPKIMYLQRITHVLYADQDNILILKVTNALSILKLLTKNLWTQHFKIKEFSKETKFLEAEFCSARFSLFGLILTTSGSTFTMDASMELLSKTFFFLFVIWKIKNGTRFLNLS